MSEEEGYRRNILPQTIRMIANHSKLLPTKDSNLLQVLENLL